MQVPLRLYVGVVCSLWCLLLIDQLMTRSCRYEVSLPLISFLSHEAFVGLSIAPQDSLQKHQGGLL